MDALRIDTIRTDATAATIVTAGEIDFDTIVALEQAIARLADDGVAEFTIDLRATSFVSLAAIGALRRCRRALAAHGGRLVVVNPTRLVARAFAVVDAAHRRQQPALSLALRPPRLN